MHSLISLGFYRMILEEGSGCIQSQKMNDRIQIENGIFSFRFISSKVYVRFHSGEWFFRKCLKLSICRSLCLLPWTIVLRKFSNILHLILIPSEMTVGSKNVLIISLISSYSESTVIICKSLVMFVVEFQDVYSFEMVDVCVCDANRLEL